MTTTMPGPPLLHQSGPLGKQTVYCHLFAASDASMRAFRGCILTLRPEYRARQRAIDSTLLLDDKGSMQGTCGSELRVGGGGGPLLTTGQQKVQHAGILLTQELLFKLLILNVHLQAILRSVLVSQRSGFSHTSPLSGVESLQIPVSMLGRICKPVDLGILCESLRTIVDHCSKKF
jgi:hypothetical protein